MDNRWVYDKSNTSMIELSHYNDECGVIQCFTSVFLDFSVRRLRVVDAPCLSEKGVKIGVGGDGSGVSSVHLTLVMMASNAVDVIRSLARACQVFTTDNRRALWIREPFRLNQLDGGGFGMAYI
ncbi:unnamed protein product [Strongylus vulgaris]|uniref:Uncharacterized protein n=1 Tax=Strongylus vulgaris TaxID=40348 RepID=A0A3P7L923_STRVU|nr:unnamed protein product [Strongylus vulgaris]